MPSKTSTLTGRQRVIVFGVLLIGSAIGLVASIVLSHEALTIAKDSSKVLGCDLNAAMSCSSVAKHWSAHVVGDIPNSFVGMVAYPVFITIAVAGLARTRFPRWFMCAAEAGGWVSLGFAGWMFYMSYIVIGALCPWCLATDAAVLLVLFALIRHNVLTDSPMISAKLVPSKKCVQQNYDVVVFVAIAVAICALIVLKYGDKLV